jgi:hypothetical protein
VTDNGAFLFRVVSNNRSQWVTSSLVAVESCNPFYDNGGLHSNRAVLPLAQSPATRVEVPPVVGPSDTVGAPDDPEFQPWSACNNLGKCVVMSGFEITAI